MASPSHLIASGKLIPVFPQQNFELPALLSCLGPRPDRKPKQQYFPPRPTEQHVSYSLKELPALPRPTKRTLLPYEYPPPSGRPSMFTQLPVELILIIAEYIDMLQQCSLMRTCRYFHQVLEPSLYRHLDLLDPDLHSRSRGLHDSLLKRPDLIDQIVTYYGPIFPLKPKPEHNGIPIFEDPRGELMSIFQKAVNIRDLYFTGYMNWIEDYDWVHIQAAVEQMVLERLVIQIGGRSVDVIPLLRTQPELTRLELLWGANGWERLKTTDIPKLKSLTATLDAAALIVPGRPVEEIDLLPSQGTRRVDESLLQCLSRSSRLILKFGMKLYSPYDEDSVQDVLQAVARELPFIEELTISVGGKISSRMLFNIPAHNTGLYGFAMTTIKDKRGRSFLGNVPMWLRDDDLITAQETLCKARRAVGESASE
ncbi:hypothetical protein FRC05_000779 [Tulasnella sp. 425]|nr:hypothetical protein FRC05_000779 [Tulasnella sp. 425]